ncbi:MAG: flagellar hook basal-body protein [Bryobacterales bacterium]|nr:flagellar hook basal-body protein [Bryobacterales bacterium]
MEALDLLANNLANSSTSGFKADQEMYGAYFGDAQRAADGTASSLPDVKGRWTNFSQGILNVTSNPTDLALSGKGFFSMQSPSGPVYTRDGQLRISKDRTLTNADGYAVLDQAGKPIRLQSTDPFDVDRAGIVRQAKQVVGQIGVVDFPTPAALEKLGNSYFKTTPASGAAALTKEPEVHQGKVEASNSAPAESAVRLVSLMRQAEFLQRAISLSGDMGRKAIDEVGKVGS